MGTGANLIFNLVTVVFLTLTLFVGLVFLMVAIEAMDPPVFAPDPTLVVPPTVVFPTLTPTITPTVDPNFTPEPTPTFEPTATIEAMEGAATTAEPVETPASP